jgi:RNA:NAD 2'-phosphotransferase (TPT1/KptA family)
MTEKEIVRASKFISLVLRHKPEEANLRLTPVHVPGAYGERCHGV